MSRCIIIGDAHGCRQEAEKLIAKCEVTEQDRVIFLGDLVDRGPDPYGMVKLAMRYESLLGNHEERQLAYHAEWTKKGAPIKPEIIKTCVRFKSPEHERSFISIAEKDDRDEVFTWMKSRPKFIRLPEYTAPDGLPVVLIHAGCLPEVPLEAQSDLILMHVSNIREPRQGYDEFGRLQHGYWRSTTETWWTSKAPPDAKYWASLYDGSHGHVVFGHSGFDDPAFFPHATGLDTGCVFGRSLTALILPEWKIVSVPFTGTRYPSDKQKFEVHPGIFVYS